MDNVQQPLCPVCRCPGIFSPEGHATYRDLTTAAQTLANELLTLDFVPGDVAILALSNQLAFLPAYLALVKAGAKVALLSPSALATQWTILKHSLNVRLCLTEPGVASPLARIETPAPRVIGTPTACDLGIAALFCETARPRCPQQLDDVLVQATLLKFTKGSTGQPKCVGLTATNLICEASSVADAMELTPTDRIFCAVPLHHSYGFDLGALSALWSGLI